MTTNVPSVVIDANGITLPQEKDILEGVQADINQAFGGGVNPGLTTPQGQLAQTTTAIIGDKNDQIAEVVNNVDPDKAVGRWQDAIGRIYFLERIAASGTVVTGSCAGLVGAVIPAGSAAQDANGYIYFSLADATIPASGSVDVDFQNSTMGPIACPIGNLSKIYTAVPGWDRVTNSAAGTLGTDVESRADFEYRRRLSVAANGVNSVQSILGRLLSVADVLDAYVIDNPKGVVVNTGATNYPLAAHSMYAAVVGGAAADVAAAIWGKKSLGCNYNGDTSYVIEDSEGYEKPYPQYTVTWQTPDAKPTFFKIQIANDPLLPSNIVDLVRAAVLNAFNGADGGSRARIGSTIYAGRYYAGVAAVNGNVNIESITMGFTSTAAAVSLAFGIDQRPTLDASNIQVLLV
ncbi:baseplate J/gp47 family protein [Pseudomonas sp. HS-18]|uniref:baseplate J/gp47 family protein n=1 Tax=Pseudomonas sp. HS-18 TaxID=2879114 RepID=UPI001CF0087D|nr:baseplate J/gp47 family protein [Pseudomonas sp. HS-18]UCL84487.1 baseplate J/gp47 family protein [Pseudomonas sp. HS-18]